MRLLLFVANFKSFYQQTTTTEGNGNANIKVSFQLFLELWFDKGWADKLWPGPDQGDHQGPWFRVSVSVLNLKILKVSNTAGFGDLHDVDAEFEKVYR